MVTLSRIGWASQLVSRYFPILSSYESFPASASWAIETAVIILNIEPVLNFVSSFTGIMQSRFAMPTAFVKKGFPFFATSTVPLKASFAARRSTNAPSCFAISASVSGFSGGTFDGVRAGEKSSRAMRWGGASSTCRTTASHASVSRFFTTITAFVAGRGGS